MLGKYFGSLRHNRWVYILNGRKFWGMVFTTIHKFWGVISDIKMTDSRHLPIEDTPIYRDYAWNNLNFLKFAIYRQIVVLLESLKNSVIEEGMVIPSIICSFTLRCLQILLRPGNLHVVLQSFD